MPRSARFLQFLLLLAVAGLPAIAIPRPYMRGNPRQQIVALEQQWRTAQIGSDIPAMEKLLSENYIGITVTGKIVTKAQQLDRMRERQLIITRFEASDIKIKVIGSGKVAIVNAIAQVEGESDKRKIDGSFRYTRVYQRLQNGTWKITNFEATRVTAPEAARSSIQATAANR